MLVIKTRLRETHQTLSSPYISDKIYLTWMERQLFKVSFHVFEESSLRKDGWKREGTIKTIFPMMLKTLSYQIKIVLK